MSVFNGVLARTTGLFLLLSLSVSAQAVPSFARQTGQPCSACHTNYPELTAFGRQFKLSGYTLSDLKQVSHKGDQSAPGVSINVIPNLSAVLQASETDLKSAPPGTANPSADFPKELALYYAGRITPQSGAFLQVTYDSGGSFAMDTSDIRAVTQGSLDGKYTVYGLDLNNGPSFEDLWNSSPGFGWPYVNNNAVVTPDSPFMASDAILTQVMGLGGYMYWNNQLYGYIGVYQAAKQGDTPTTADGLVNGAPYYRLAWTPQPNWMIGSFGFFAKYQPNPGVSIKGPDQSIQDIGVDTQYQKFLGTDTYSLLASVIYESRDNLDATVAGYNGPNSINTYYARLVGNWYHRERYGVGVGLFATGGDRSTYYNAMNPGVTDGTGYRADTSPDDRGGVLELDYLPQQNVRLSLQYTAYLLFHGHSSNYDGNGRSASDNNTLLLNALVGF